MALIFRNPSATDHDNCDARHLEALAHQAVETGQITASRGVPDGFHYEIVVDGRTVHCADPHLSDAQRELVRTVLKEGA